MRWFQIKLRNRRVRGRILEDGGILLWYRRWTLRDGITDTKLRLSEEAAFATVQLLSRHTRTEQKKEEGSRKMDRGMTELQIQQLETLDDTEKLYMSTRRLEKRYLRTLGKHKETFGKNHKRTDNVYRAWMHLRDAADFLNVSTSSYWENWKDGE